MVFFMIEGGAEFAVVQNEEPAKEMCSILIAN